MDAELKAKLVDALRSGKYPQGQRALLNNGCYCCIGVLCDLMGAKWQAGTGDQFAVIDGAIQQYYLEDGALFASGLTEDEQEKLYNMNDNGESFSHIADYIEANL